VASPTYAAPVSIDGPPPSPPALTLVGAARVVSDAGDRWINGAGIWPYPRDLPDRFDPCQPAGSAGHAKDAGTPAVPEVFGSFTVVEGITCTTRSVRDPAEWQARAQKALEAYEHWTIENEFWTGALKPDNTHLAESPAAVMVQAATTNPRHGLALLEQAIADKGGSGVIHLRPAVFSLLDHTDLSVNAGVAKTQLGTKVVPGVGYPGTSPAQAALATTVEWAYATGSVELRRSEVFIVPGSIVEATDRAQNVTTFRAERHVLIVWDTRIHAAVKIDRAFTGYAS
jgi:hypothetical protein